MSTQTRTIAFHTLGCKLNFSETATISRDFIDRGFQVIDAKSKADIYVINTCSVTDNADKECRKIVRQVKRRSPGAVVAMIGCYAQLKPEEVAESTGADIVLGTAEKFQLCDTLESHVKTNEPIILHTETKDLDAFTPSYSASERTRVFLKIQDGCDYPCTYCTIPLARGKSRNDTIKNTVKLAMEIGRTEAREIVLTGVNIGDFGTSTKESFFDLIRALDDVEGIDRFRVSSIEPNLLTNNILDFIKDSRTFVHHFHIPLQSGSNKILSDMKRRYWRELYADRVQAIKQRFPDACIGADVIVGFPTETDVDFEETVQFIKDLDIEYLHVFSYSERSGTFAAGMANAVSLEAKMERSKRLRILSEKKRFLFHERFKRQTMPVLFEAIRGNRLMGHTQNYILVYAEGKAGMINHILPVQLAENRGRSMRGKIQSKS
ncbi:MAG: tRNA (N(6)-L-threonylcarbamoyladenosine(37)-C(2))-methylthiotransferase MtaB [Simkaniaceae bacterium]|nr:tRNA (N(6)-L-threonylcarbamoyladenosine(37)-C(2))-methylthiotransferase MtaB [Simkaniaceae bacterium]